ncbi:hypothetical protein MTR67_015469 [Solanum verrucosum]|uniref:Cytochrome P450 n=1 Tax=Solanum verrucosum TaxID=315347 RepID=A0AAF0QLI0_SOLVR|nr:hypothetical protein MTR67_015469 [Solanum verrucosum]
MQDMFIAGAETSSAIIIWALAEMIRNPRTMAKAQFEVRQVLKGKTIFEDTDLEELKEETRIGEYTIPVKTRVLINAWAIGRDPEYWHNPESFIPERFDNNHIDFQGNHFPLVQEEECVQGGYSA